jgi:hypothetical protein
MGKGSRSLATAGKRHDEYDLALRLLQHRQQRIAAAKFRHALCVLWQWLVARHKRGLAAAQQQRPNCREDLF